MTRLIAVRVGSHGRTNLVAGTYYPDATNTGYYPGTLTSTISSNTTYSTAGQQISNINFNGARVSVTAANVTFTNCNITGDLSANSLVTCTNVGASNVKFVDCTIRPAAANDNSNNTNAFSGHDTTFLRCDISGTTDLFQISNTSTTGWNGGANPNWATGMVIKQCYLHGLSRWTAATGGVVHPTDTVTHNDVIQIFGGSGLQVIGNTIDARWELQWAHMWLKSSGGTIYTRAQAQALPDAGPFISVAIGSLSDGGPFVAPFNSNGTGLRSRGEYDLPDLSGLMLNATQGPTTAITFTDNLCMGGEFFTNGGGNPNPNNGRSLGSFLRNGFTRDQGNQGSGTGNGHTLDFGGTWSGSVTAPTTGVDKNFYIDDLSAITVRT